MESTDLPVADLARIDHTLATIGAAKVSADGPAEVVAFVDQLLDDYRGASSTWREELRRRIASHRSLLGYLFTYMERSIRQLRTTGDPRWVQRTLAAISLEDAHPDQRDTYTRAAQLRTAAADLGLDLEPYAAEAVAQANSQRTVGFVSTAALIQELGQRQ